ncbi:MAG: transketolase [Magnetococcales bacterium]|nr:transketolase [Magnetococcales bacterium]
MDHHAVTPLPPTEPAPPQGNARSRHLRRLMVRAFAAARRGHLGSALSMTEILQRLYDDFLRHRPGEPLWPDRDRCILSKGHGCLGLYAILADKGYFPLADLDGFSRFDSPLGGHPERHRIPGVEASTGALGHGLGIGLGMALAARLQKRASRVVVILGDGEINEGSVWEAALAAGKHRLDNLLAIVDYNRFQSYGAVTSVLPLEPLVDKWRAFGFATREVDGHDLNAIGDALEAFPFAGGKPSLILAHTIKGKGVPFLENDPAWHHQSRVADAVIDRMVALLADPPQAGG